MWLFVRSIESEQWCLGRKPKSLSEQSITNDFLELALSLVTALLLARWPIWHIISYYSLRGLRWEYIKKIKGID